MRILGWALAVLALGMLPRSLLADGMMVPRETALGKAVDLVSSPKQEAVLATDGHSVTVILRTHFAKGPEELAWIVPVPSRPTNIGARSDDIFTQLESATVPRFYMQSAARGSGFGCAATRGVAVGEEVRSTVTREDSGAAGIFQYDVLAATNVNDLTGWLSKNHYALPPNLEPALAPYVEKHYHFLAMRLRPEASAAATLAPHPVAYTYLANDLVYPMIVSRVSAAQRNEITLYVLVSRRYECANWTNFTAEDLSVTTATDTASGTNYERQMRHFSDRDLHVFITEFAGDFDGVLHHSLLEKIRNESPVAPRPAGVDDAPHYLTRLRALIAPAAMDRDVVLIPRDGQGDVGNSHRIAAPVEKSGIGSPWLMASAGAIAVNKLLRRIRRRKIRVLKTISLAAIAVAAAALAML